MTPGPEKVHSSSDSVCREAPPVRTITHEKVDASHDLASLVEIFPVSTTWSTSILSNHNFTRTCDHILDEFSIDALHSLAVGHHVFILLSESPRIILDDEAEDWVHPAASFYNFSKFNPNA